MSNFIDSLMSKLSRKEDDIRNKKVMTSESKSSDFIPYACHYDKDTILTKNGELIQSICIKSFIKDNVNESGINLRDHIRTLVSEKIHSNKYSVYFHTIREKRDLDNKHVFKNAFAEEVHNTWVEQNSWDSTYINELYITIVSSSMPINVGYKNFFYKMFTLRYTVRSHAKYLADAVAGLHKVVEDLKDNLSSYGAYRLSLRKNSKQGYASEFISFFSKIAHMEYTVSSIPESDLSKFLGRNNIKFSDSIFQRKGKKPLFGMVVSFKRHDSISDKSIDRLLQMSVQFTISQSLIFIGNKKGQDLYSYQKYLSEVNEDDSFRKVSGLDNYYKSMDKANGLRKSSYCESQIVLVVTENSIEQLEESLNKVALEFGSAGIPIVLEDLNAEHCFWSQLPGNFRYLQRKNIIPISDIGSFASLYNFPFGSLKSIWGDYISLFKTQFGSPYFFNFHVGHKGHTVISGNSNTSLLNFIVSQSMKLNPSIFYLDSDSVGHNCIERLGGKYLKLGLSSSDSNIKINPLLLPDNDSNRTFLKYWFMFLLDKYSNPENIELYLDAVEDAIDAIFKLDASDRKLRNAPKFFNNKKFKDINSQIIEELEEWIGEGKLAHIFDAENDDLMESDSSVVGIDVSEIESAPMYLNMPIISYLLYFFKTRCQSDNGPSMLVVPRGNALFNNIYFEKNLTYILKDLEDLNAVLLTQTSFASNKVNWSRVVAQVYNRRMVTKIFLDDMYTYDQDVKQIFEISEDENLYLKSLTSSQFLLRQGDKSIVCQFNYPSDI